MCRDECLPRPLILCEEGAWGANCRVENNYHLQYRAYTLKTHGGDSIQDQKFMRCVCANFLSPRTLTFCAHANSTSALLDLKGVPSQNRSSSKVFHTV